MKKRCNASFYLDLLNYFLISKIIFIKSSKSFFLFKFNPIFVAILYKFLIIKFFFSSIVIFLFLSLYILFSAKAIKLFKKELPLFILLGIGISSVLAIPIDNDKFLVFFKFSFISFLILLTIFFQLVLYYS